MKDYLAIISISGYETILERIKAESDSEAIKTTALITLKQLWGDECEQEQEQINVKPLDVINDLYSSTDLMEVIIYNIADDKTIIRV